MAAFLAAYFWQVTLVGLVCALIAVIAGVCSLHSSQRDLSVTAIVIGGVHLAVYASIILFALLGSLWGRFGSASCQCPNAVYHRTIREIPASDQPQNRKRLLQNSSVFDDNYHFTPQFDHESSVNSSPFDDGWSRWHGVVEIDDDGRIIPLLDERWD